MIRKLLKPSWRKLLITACLYGMVGLSSDFDKAAREVARNSVAESILGQSYSDEIKRIYNETRCEAEEQVALARDQLMARMEDEGLASKLEFQIQVMSGVTAAALIAFCYLMACIACTGAVIRLREKPDFS